MNDANCRWARARLPLFDGGELAGFDRRKVERHLITCNPCRDRRRSLADGLRVLQALADWPTPRPDAPSLWPALARQIRQERHPEPVSSRSRFWALFAGPALGLGLAILIAFAGLAAVRYHPDDLHVADRPESARPALPAPQIVSRPAPSSALDPAPVPADDPTSRPRPTVAPAKPAF